MVSDKFLEDILNKFVKELNLLSVIQFGSSVNSADYDDIDLLMISSHEIIPTAEHLKLIKLIKKFEKKYKGFVFDFGGTSSRKKEGEKSVTIIHLNKKHLNFRYSPAIVDFLGNRAIDKNMNILYGKNPFLLKKNKLCKAQKFEMLSTELKHSVLRKSLDDKKYLNEGIYHAFKIFLRVMVDGKELPRKEDLLTSFNNKYKNKINLPRNSSKILKKKFSNEDFEEVLKFMEDCLNHLK